MVVTAMAVGGRRNELLVWATPARQKKHSARLIPDRHFTVAGEEFYLEAIDKISSFGYKAGIDRRVETGAGKNGQCACWPGFEQRSDYRGQIYPMDIFFPLIGYLIGAIPFGLLIGKMVGVDVRTQGSRNIGATNVNRVLGKKLGAITLICDVVKGLLPMYLAASFLPESATKELLVAITGVLGVLGHMFPVYLKFRGGKGVATGLGMFLYLSPLAIGISLLVFVATVAVSGFVSAGSLLASGLIPLWLYLLGGSKISIGAAAGVAVLIWIKHHENINRLVHGKEQGWRKDKAG
jgi:acyl phosphate:glycerol-3-phosphate acyltransferase